MKRIKITKEQYKKLADAGLIKEDSSFDSNNPVNKTFKKAFAGKDVSNFEYIPEEDIVKNNDFNIEKQNSSIPKLNIKEVENLIKYTYGVDESLSPYWIENNLAYEELCEALENKGLFVKKENTYRIPKNFGSPDETKKAIHETLSEMLNHNMQEDYPIGAEHDPMAPYNRPDDISSIGREPENYDYKIIYNNLEFSIFKSKSTGELCLFNHTNIDRRKFDDYAEKHGYKDLDGDKEYYDDWEVDNGAIERYFNDVIDTTNIGDGLDAFESGEYDIIKIDNPLKNDLLSLYDKDKKLVKVLSNINEDYQRTPEEQKDIDKSVNKLKLKAEKDKQKKDPKQLELDLDETTGAANSGSFVTGAFLEPMEEDGVIRREINEMNTGDAGKIGYDNPGFAGISRDGEFPKNRKKTKAEQKTQWAGGSFVDFDDCTKLNNNKKAQNGGCSTGAVDNVVKQRKTSISVNAPSLGKGISEGRTFSIYKLEKKSKK